MSLAQPQRTADRLAARDPQVYHPLDRLRGVIRRYVVIEGALSAVLFVSVWFTLGLILDYGLFKVSGWDWVRDGARWVRLVALLAALGVFASILVFRIARRVNKEFSYPALALVLERKFPKQLGDRLITAVEMADVEAMGRFGYSTEMIRATIAEARERVGTVPVEAVFNWKRLWVLGLLAVGLFAGTVTFAAAAHATAVGEVQPYRFGWKFAHVTGIFAERNLALMNTPWPRRAHLELVGFPEGGELNVGRDAPAPRVTARAVKWVIADRDTPDGWRPLLWSDLTAEFVGRKVPELPPEVAAAVPGRTFDGVERLAFDNGVEAAPEVAAFRDSLKRSSTGGVAYEEMQAVFRAVEEKAERPGMGRTLRKLEVPDEVTYRYSGRRTGGGGTLSPQQNSEFAGEIGGLKEDVTFTVRGADYESTPRKIRLIPPPTLRRIGRDQAEPAYLHHTTPQDKGYDALENRLQKVSAKDLSLTGERTVFVVPAGTELTLIAEAYRADDGTIPETDRIVSAHAVPVAGRFPGTVYDADARPTQTPVPLAVSADGGDFRITFAENKVGGASVPRLRNVGGDFAGVATAAGLAAVKKHTDFRLTENVEFKVTFANPFGITTTRSFLIQVVQDQPPSVEFAVDVIRKVGNFYMVTPRARIPFNPDSFVKDDRGLSKVEYTFSYWAEDSDLIRAIRAKYAVRSLLDVPLPGTSYAAALPFRHADNFRVLDKSDDRLTSSVFVSDFAAQNSRLPRNTVADFERLLKEPRDAEAAPPAVRKVELKDPGRDYFDLKELHDLGILKIAASGGDVQTIYRMDLNVQATDNNVDAEGGPRVARNVEPIKLRVVSESDLLIEIGREVETLAAKLDEALTKLAVAKKKFAEAQSQYVALSSRYERARPNQQPDLDAKKQLDFQLTVLTSLALESLQNVERARDTVSGVVREFRRIERECEINRLNDAARAEPKKFADALEALLREGAEGQVGFPRTQGQMTRVHGGLTAMSAAMTDRVKDPGDRTPLPDAVPAALVAEAENSLTELDKELRRIRDQLGEAQSKEKLKKELIQIKEQQARIRREIQGMQEYWVSVINSPDPLLGPIGAVSLGKGESKKLEHKIEWRQYKEDDLIVKVTTSDPSITVTPELKLNFETNTFRFTHEIKAGGKEGTFKVTLTPAVGKPVEVQVIVK
jgi:hypothetical protein